MFDDLTQRQQDIVRAALINYRMSGRGEDPEVEQELIELIDTIK